MNNLALAAVLVTLSISLLRIESALAEDSNNKYSCPHGWTRFGNKKCLKYINELQDYDRAQATCRSKNQGSLVTIHSHEEQNFVYSYIHSIAASSTPIWLGAKQIDFESILWLDKTENAYTNWAPSEPSHPDEICIAINPRNGMWHDVMCTDSNVPACERAPTTQWPFFVAFCSEGWFQFNDEKCVRIISSQALNFYESQELCRSKYNSKLLSIKSDKESEFLHNLIKFRDVKLPVWLGAVQNDFSSFNWIDKSDVTFTNWAEGEPNDPDHACLSMIASGGKWADNDCKEQKLILCQKAVPEDSVCETGWLQFRQDKCYRFVHIRLAFEDAESLCNSLYGGHLPSIHSQEEQFMLTQFLASVNVKNGSEIWLGGRQMDFHNFNWGDGSLFNYSYWEHGEPNFPAEKCIEMSWRNGRWNDINCRLKRAVLCERQVTTRQSPKIPLYNPYACLDQLQSNCTSESPSRSAGGQLDQLPGQQSDQQDVALMASLPVDKPAMLPTLNVTSSIPASELPIGSTSGLSNRTSVQEEPVAGQGVHKPSRDAGASPNKDKPVAQSTIDSKMSVTQTNNSVVSLTTSAANASSAAIPVAPVAANSNADLEAVSLQAKESLSARKDEAAAKEAVSSVKNQQSSDSPSTSLMDKLKPKSEVPSQSQSPVPVQTLYSTSSSTNSTSLTSDAIDISGANQTEPASKDKATQSPI